MGDLKPLGQQRATQAGREALPEVLGILRWLAYRHVNSQLYSGSLSAILDQILCVQVRFQDKIRYMRRYFADKQGFAYKAACVLGIDNPARSVNASERPNPWLD